MKKRKRAKPSSLLRKKFLTSRDHGAIITTDREGKPYKPERVGR
jgi:hypothetical protein